MRAKDSRTTKTWGCVSDRVSTLDVLSTQSEQCNQLMHKFSNAVVHAFQEVFSVAVSEVHHELC
jgi:hypothetical protein